MIEEVCTLKQVLSIAEVKQIIDERYRKTDADYSVVFNQFKNSMTEKNLEAVDKTKQALENIQEDDLRSLTDLAVDLALTANAYISISKRILFLNKLLDEQNNEKNEKRKRKKKKRRQTGIRLPSFL